MPDNEARAYAVSVRALQDRGPEGTLWVESPTFYLHADVQGIVAEHQAENIVREWLGKLADGHSGLEVAVAETNVEMANPQADALLDRVRTNKASLVYAPPGAGLPDDYVYVIEANPPKNTNAFECGIAPDGRVSS